jgi:hypothetical protein
MQDLLLDSLVQAIAKKVMAKISFPHFDAEGHAGYELKNRDFMGFASERTKELWVSSTRSDDDCIVFCENTIFALSHAVLFRDENTCHASIEGNPDPVQPELIRAAAARMRACAEITAAMDADVEGRKLAEVVMRAVEMSGRGDLHFHIHEPSGFKDWSDQLRAKPRSLLSYRPEQPLMP